MDEWKMVPVTPTSHMMRESLINPDEAARYYGRMLAAAPAPPHMSMTREEAQTFQSWAGMDGACAFHLIERHANGWGDVGRMMDAWLHANLKPPNARLTGQQRPAQE
jgi:hypothetical protein